jgi:hypothetical protein
MNTNVRHAVLAALVIVILVVLALTSPAPLLYSLEKDAFPSPFHGNPEALKEQSLNSTTDIAPQIQDFIDYTGPVSLSIRIHDIGQARRDLERFGKSQGSLKNLIVKLDMNESEIQEIERNTALQKEILESLLNTSVSLDTLQSMEIQYHSQNNNDMLTTVRLRGDELRKKVRGMNQRYRNATEKVVAVSTKLGLDVTGTQESQKQVEQIVREIEQPDSRVLLPVDTTLIPGDDRVSLFIRPDSGRYREVIEFQGISLTLRGNTTLRAEAKPITIYLDDMPYSTVVTDTFGYYNAKLPIERTPAGTHTVYARSPTSRSMNRTLSVFPVESVTNLTLGKPDADGNVNCTGSVMANVPVRSAPVQITWDQTHVIVTNTDANGLFMRKIQLPPGRHTVIAGFSGSGYPINPSESAPRIVDISLIRGIETDYGLLLAVIAIIGILILFAGIAAFYIRRMSQRKIPLPGTLRDTELLNDEDSGISPDGSPTPGGDAMDESLIAGYTRILREQGLSAASWRVYQQLAGRLARDLHIRRHRTLTARELSRNCQGKPYCGAFARFTTIYERIRYGGLVSVKDQAVFETAIAAAHEQMGGDDH